MLGFHIVNAYLDFWHKFTLTRAHFFYWKWLSSSMFCLEITALWIGDHAVVPVWRLDSFFTNDSVFQLLHLRVVDYALFVFLHIFTLSFSNFYLLCILQFIIWLFIQIACSLWWRMFSPKIDNWFHHAQIWSVKGLIFDFIHVESWPVQSFCKIIEAFLWNIIIVKRLMRKLDG